MKAFQLMLLNMMLLVILLKLRQQRLQRRVRQKLCTSSLTGRLYMRELLEGSTAVVYTLIRMDTNAFVHLCDHFREMGYLHDSKHLDVEEKMMIFLQIISQSMGNRLVRHRFQHSAETISKYFHEVLLGVLEFAKEILVAPSWETPVPVEQIRNYSKLRKGPFKGDVGALDGTLIHAVVPLERQTPFRGRGGGECYQNVLAICDFDMKFIYVVSGWEGVAHDSRILSESVRNPAFNFPMPPPDKYYLCDAVYTHTKGFMTPYRNTRYWLRDFRRGGRPRTKKEKFNQAHSQLRNMIERAFVVLKARFPILDKMRRFSFTTQKYLVVATMAIHNFLRRIRLNDELFRRFEDVGLEVNNNVEMHSESATSATQHVFRPQDQTFMHELRDQVANELDILVRV